MHNRKEIDNKIKFYIKNCNSEWDLLVKIDKTIYIFIEQFQLTLEIMCLYCLNFNACIVYCKVDTICNNIWSNSKSSKEH